MQARRAVVAASVALAALLCASSSELAAETLKSALAKAYQGNPQLNAQRALVRATDENVPQALSGYRPKIAATATLGEERTFITEQAPLPNGKLQPLSKRRKISRRTATAPRQLRRSLTANKLLTGPGPPRAK